MVVVFCGDLVGGNVAVTLLILAQLLDLVKSIAIDNGVIGVPTVTCRESVVSITFETERPFNGRIFVKGMADDEECSRSFAANYNGLAPVFNVPAGNCNMRRTRRVGSTSRGIEQTMTVVISFHGVFITKVDRAYRCTCFFMETDKTVSSKFDVSMLPTTALVDTARMPLCSYAVRQGSITGPSVAYASVGQEVYHVWDCDSDTFGMLVHSCFVDDGAGGEKFELLDTRGCSVDPTIMADVTYNQQLNMAYVEAHVAKFPDQSTTYFQCAVSVCLRNEGACSSLSPPSCRSDTLASKVRAFVARSRSRRDAVENGLVPSNSSESLPTKTTRLITTDFDLNAEPIVVLDIDDFAYERDSPTSTGVWPISPQSSATDNSGYRSHLAHIISSSTDERLSVRTRQRQQVCLSPGGFGLLLAVLLLTLLACVTAIALLYARQRALNTALLKR